MFKEARKPSNDPVQEKLRQNKAQWNKEVSGFIDNLINLKKLMNGWPSKFNMERSSIKDPLPKDPGTILGALAGDFQELAQKGNSLISQQADYAKNRKKKQAPSTTVPTTPSTSNLSQQLVAGLDYQLEATGSNPVTRFYSKLQGPWLGSSPEARNKKYRISMLNSCADLYKQLEKFESAVVGSSATSIFTASKILDKIENQVNFILSTSTAYKAIAPEALKHKITNTVNDLKLEEINSVILDFKKNYLNFTNLDSILVQQLLDNISVFESSSLEDQETIISTILDLYKSIIDDFNKKNGTSAKTLSEALFAKQAKSSNQLESLAFEFLTKWLGKIKHQLSPFDKTSALRLDVFRLAEESRKILNDMMNSLEKEYNVESLILKTNELYTTLSSMRSIMKPLEDTIKNNMFDKTFVNLLKNNKLTEYDFDLDIKQKERLQRMLEIKQFRSLTNMYNKK